MCMFKGINLYLTLLVVVLLCCGAGVTSHTYGSKASAYNHSHSHSHSHSHEVEAKLRREIMLTGGPTVQELRGQHLVMIGDSLMRYVSVSTGRFSSLSLIYALTNPSPPHSLTQLPSPPPTTGTNTYP